MGMGCAGDDDAAPGPVDRIEDATVAQDSASASDTSTRNDTSVEADVATGEDVFSPVDDTPSVPAEQQDGERCETAYELLSSSSASSEGNAWDYVLSGEFGQSNDYNPLDSAGLPPACSMVFDAVGNEVVYSFVLSPGQTISLEYSVAPSKVPGGVYFLSSCPDGDWPDTDMSGACGDNEYKAQGFCAISCEVLGLALTHPPVDREGNPTADKTYWLVLDTVGAAPGESWELNYNIIDPE